MLPTTVPLMATISGASVQLQTAEVRVRVPVSEIVGGVSVVRLMTAAEWKPPGSVGESPQLAAPSAAQRTMTAPRVALVRFPITTLILARNPGDQRPLPRDKPGHAETRDGQVLLASGMSKDVWRPVSAAVRGRLLHDGTGGGGRPRRLADAVNDALVAACESGTYRSPANSLDGPSRPEVLRADREDDVVDEREGVLEHESFHLAVVSPAPMRPRKERPADLDLAQRLIVGMEA